ncbi:hypothetical protein VNO78_13816 [Psophocarpus tetragonolobus]|uniref:Uncharacterized protein n=1 Tax=Psophocarpus tetragonolobus TaxID=3891 RepID=A0AAN9SZB0_PSOTE
MAKNNKYASINFNHIYEKTTNNNTTNHKNPSLSSSSAYSSASYSAVSAPNKPHGRILVLTRPTPKPITSPTPTPTPTPTPQQQHPPPNPTTHTPPRSEPGSDAISLRPLGRTGAGSPLSPVPVPVPNLHKDLPSPQPKSNKFVPPHLRPGFVPREESPPPGPDSLRPNGRPKSGGGPHERMRRGGGSDAGIMGRRSRPNSSGWYVNIVACCSFYELVCRLRFIYPFVLCRGLSFPGRIISDRNTLGGTQIKVMRCVYGVLNEQHIDNGYEVEFFSKDEDKHILLERWVLYTNQCMYPLSLWN